MSLHMTTGVLDPVLLKFLTCGYCKKIYKDPRILPCNHTYCGNCLVDMKKTRTPFLCPECKLPLPINIQTIKRDQKTIQLLSDVLIQESECPGEVDPELEKWFKQEKCPKIISRKLIRNGYWELDIVREMSEVEVSQLGLLPGLEKKLLLMISNSKGHGVLTRSSTTLSCSSTHSRSRTASSSHSEADEDERLPQRWHELERLYDGRVLVSGSQPNDSLRFLLFLGENEREEIVKLVKEQGHVVKEDKSLTSEFKAECCRKVALVLCDAGAYDDGVDYARLALNFSTSIEEKYNTKVLLVYSLYRKIAEDTWGQNVDQKPLHTELVELCDDIIKNQRNMSVSKLCKVHIQKALTLNRLYELEKLVSFLVTSNIFKQVGNNFHFP